MLGNLSQGEIEALLRTEVVARLGCHAGGRTYVVPVCFVYDGHGLVIQSAEGLKLRMLRQNPLVCVEVDRIDTLSNWRSVIAWGRFEELSGVEAVEGLGRLRDRLQPLMPSETTPSALHPSGDDRSIPRKDSHAAVYRIRLLETTGRFESS